MLMGHFVRCRVAPSVDAQFLLVCVSSGLPPLEEKFIVPRPERKRKSCHAPEFGLGQKSNTEEGEANPLENNIRI